MIGATRFWGTKMLKEFNGWKVVKFLSGNFGQWACIAGACWFTAGAIADKNTFYVAALCFLGYPLLWFINIVATLCSAGRDMEISEFKKNENQ